MDAQVRAILLALMAAKMDVTDVVDVQAHVKDARVAQGLVTEVVYNHAQAPAQTRVYKHALELAQPHVQETALVVQPHALQTAIHTAPMTV